MMIVEWPNTIPCEPETHDYWLWKDTRDYFARLLGPQTIAYVELGSWCGASARLAAELAPNACLYCVDTWDGRGGLQYNEHATRSLELFQANLWEYRNRVVMLQTTTLRGVRELIGRRVQPDVVYIDADHSYNAAMADMVACWVAFPNAVICGDDYNESPGRAATTMFGAENIEVGWKHKFWRVKDAQQSQETMPALSSDSQRQVSVH